VGNKGKATIPQPGDSEVMMGSPEDVSAMMHG
jgi:hypothetical protein